MVKYSHMLFMNNMCGYQLRCCKKFICLTPGIVCRYFCTWLNWSGYAYLKLFMGSERVTRKAWLGVSGKITDMNQGLETC